MMICDSLFFRHWIRKKKISIFGYTPYLCNTIKEFKISSYFYSVGHDMVLMVSHWPFTTEARTQSQASSCGIWKRQTGNGTSFYPNALFFSPLSIIPLVLYAHSSITNTI